MEQRLGEHCATYNFRSWHCRHGKPKNPKKKIDIGKARANPNSLHHLFP